MLGLSFVNPLRGSRPDEIRLRAYIECSSHPECGSFVFVYMNPISVSMVWLLVIALVSTLLVYGLAVALRLFNELQLRRRTKGRLVLTFDDGPSALATGAIRALLLRESVRATFFVSGFRSKEHAGLVSDALREGHDIGSHGYLHLHGWRRPFKSLIDVLDGLKSLRQLHPSARFFRPPFGKATLLTHLICWFSGYRFVYWTIDCKDAEREGIRSPDDVVAEFLREGGGVVLLHDLDIRPDAFPDRNSKVLEICNALISCAKSRGMSISTISDVLD